MNLRDYSLSKKRVTLKDLKRAFDRGCRDCRTRHVSLGDVPYKDSKMAERWVAGFSCKREGQRKKKRGNRG